MIVSGWHSLCIGGRWVLASPLTPHPSPLHRERAVGGEERRASRLAEHTRRAPPMKQTIKRIKAASGRGKGPRGRPRSNKTWQDDVSFDQAFADVEMTPMEREFSTTAGTDGASTDD